MKDIQKYQGVFPAFYACYDRDGEISPAAVRELTAFLIQKGVKGVYVGGSSGECIYQSVPERKLVLDCLTVPFEDIVSLTGDDPENMEAAYAFLQ